MSPEIPTDILHYLCTTIHTTLPPPLALQTLQSCSLASRSFLDPARARIFHKISLTYTSRYRFSSFIKLTKANPQILLYVRELFLEDTKAIGWSRLLTHDARLGVLLRSLAGLEVLTVRCQGGTMVWGKFSQEVRSALESLLKGGGRLRVLSLGTVQVPLEMLVGCGGLRKLEMKGVSLMANDNTFKTPDSQHTTQLESLKISDSTIGTRLLLKLASSPDSGFDFSSLRHLSFAPLTAADLELINVFLQSFSPNAGNAVEDLEVDLVNLRDRVSINLLNPNLTLAPLSRLRTLTLRILPRRFRNARFPRVLCAILRSIEDPFNSQLEEINIVLSQVYQSPSLANLKALFVTQSGDDWRELDTLLTTPSGQSSSALANDGRQGSSLYLPALRRLFIQLQLIGPPMRAFSEERTVPAASSGSHAKSVESATAEVSIDLAQSSAQASQSSEMDPVNTDEEPTVALEDTADPGMTTARASSSSQIQRDIISTHGTVRGRSRKVRGAPLELGKELRELLGGHLPGIMALSDSGLEFVVEFV